MEDFKSSRKLVEKLSRLINECMPKFVCKGVYKHPKKYIAFNAPTTIFWLRMFRAVKRQIGAFDRSEEQMKSKK